MTKWEEEMLEIINSGRELTESEIGKLVDRFEIEVENGSNRRWSRTNTSICQVGDRYFKVEWEQGLTENQEDYYGEQPVEVELFEEERTVTKTFMYREWKEK